MSQITPGLYKHYKGMKYLVLGTALHSETMEPLVVYVSLYDNDRSAMWVRPAAMFAEMVEVDGQKVPRFEKLEERT